MICLAMLRARASQCFSNSTQFAATRFNMRWRTICRLIPVQEHTDMSANTQHRAVR
jgi:hypothetical protein